MDPKHFKECKEQFCLREREREMERGRGKRTESWVVGRWGKSGEKTGDGNYDRNILYEKLKY